MNVIMLNQIMALAYGIYCAEYYWEFGITAE
jgi:hypothetical protein